MQALTLLGTLAALLFLIVQHRRLAQALVARSPAPAPPGPYPSLTIIRPIRGLDVGAHENLQALFDSDYPGALQLLLVLDDAEDEAFPLVRDLTAADPRKRAHILLAGPPPSGTTGKLHAMAIGVRAATGALVGFSDSDTRLDRSLLQALVDRLLATPESGSVFAPALAGSQPRTAGDVGYALMLNTWYGAVAAGAAARSHELPFIMGQLMIFRREVLEAIGGVESAAGQLVDDMYLGLRVFERGYHNVMSERSLRIVTGSMSFGDFLRLMRRWLLFSRNGLPARFKRPAWLRGAAVGTSGVALMIALARGWLFAALLAATTILVACASDIALHRRFGGAPIPPRWAWLTLVVPFLGPFALASLLVDHRVGWRGREYELDDDAHLESASIGQHQGDEHERS